jgi:SsrA-binding protein
MDQFKIISNNRKAFHEYKIGDTWEAGIVLTGTEVKSLRAGKCNLGDGWVDIDGRGEAWLRDAQITPYSHGTHANHLEKRSRKLLLHKAELLKIARQIEEKGLTIIPLKIYFKDSRVKVEIAVARGKQAHDKRESTKTREANRDMARALRTRNKG